MQSKPQGANISDVVATHGVAEPPVPADYGPTISSLSAVLSLLALLVSGITYLRSFRRDKLDVFEADHGTPLRLALRQLDASARDLRALIMPSAKDLDELKSEIPMLLNKMEVDAQNVIALVAEVDASAFNSSTGWSDSLIGVFDTCSTCVEGLTATSIVTIEDFRQKAQTAKQRYDDAVKDARSKLDMVRSSIR